MILLRLGKAVARVFRYCGMPPSGQNLSPLGMASLQRGEVLHLDGAPSGQRLFSLVFRPPSRPRGLVVMAHGFAEHSGPYVDLAERLAKRGFLVSVHDHIGHGRSQGARAMVDNCDRYVRDLCYVTKTIGEGVVPRFLVGHSMGGTIALLTALSPDIKWDGLVLVAPAVIPAPEVAGPWKVAAVKMLGRLVPGCPVGSIVIDQVTSDPDRRKSMMEDEYRYHGFCKAGWVLAMLNAFQDIQRHLADITVPLLLLHGDRDTICALEGSKIVVDGVSSKVKDLKIYQGALHGLFMETEDVRQRTMADIEEWLEARG